MAGVLLLVAVALQIVLIRKANRISREVRQLRSAAGKVNQKRRRPLALRQLLPTSKDVHKVLGRIGLPPAPHDPVLSGRSAFEVMKEAPIYTGHILWRGRCIVCGYSENHILAVAKSCRELDEGKRDDPNAHFVFNGHGSIIKACMCWRCDETCWPCLKGSVELVQRGLADTETKYSQWNWTEKSHD